MAKICKHEGCNYPVFSKLHCLYHQYVVKKPVRIRPVSKATAQKLKTYSTLRREYLIVHNKCEAGLPGCDKRGTEIHHKAGREKYLLDNSTWMAVCRWCHDTIHTKMSLTEAIEKGLRIKRN
jgi:hypothetical protein